jgi:hypothetical protein
MDTRVEPAHDGSQNKRAARTFRWGRLVENRLGRKAKTRLLCAITAKKSLIIVDSVGFIHNEIDWAATKTPVTTRLSFIFAVRSR